jgi:hypothetical protein
MLRSAATIIHAPRPRTLILILERLAPHWSTMGAPILGLEIR